MKVSDKPIVIITGSNGGVGYGSCQRLLVQLSTPVPPDSLPQAFEEGLPRNAPVRERYPGVTLIMACRSVSRAEKARKELLAFFDAHVEKEKRRPGYDGHAEEFRKGLEVVVEYVDLASVKTVLDFCERVRSKYPYISHLMCNAGVASFDRINWALAIHQVLTSFMMAVTAPLFYTQHSGELSVDGLGWVWQCNLFGHFLMVRELQSLLASTPPDSLGEGRVIWCSSIEATPAFMQAERRALKEGEEVDWQLKRTAHSYESSKYQIDLVATTLDREAVARSGGRVRHLVSTPGVCSTNVAHALIGPFLEMVKVWFFYIVRWLGSPHHPIIPYKSAIASVHLALVPLACLAFFLNPKSPPVRFGAETDRCGRERVGITPVKAWIANEELGRELVEKCDELVGKMKEWEGRGVVSETASERM